MGDNIEPMPMNEKSTNPFGTPISSSRNASSSAIHTHFQEQNTKYFHSRRVRKGEVEKPWLAKKDPREKWVTIIPCIGLFLGLALAAFLVFDGLKTVVHHEYCSVLDVSDFSGGLDPAVWTKEVESGGFGYVYFFMRY